MYIEEKYNSTEGHKGYLWGEEVNTIVEELVNLFRAFFKPNGTRRDQVLTGVNYLTMFNLWHGTIIEDNYTLLRKQELPIPDFIYGLSGDIRIIKTNQVSPLYIKMLGKEPMIAKMHGVDIPVNGLLVNNIYKFFINKDDDDKLFIELFNASVKTDIVINEGSGKIITIEPTLIEDDKIKLKMPANGDVVLNMAQVYTVDDNGNVTNQYDIKNVKINPDNNLEVLILNENDGIDVNGRYAVISYSI